MEKYEKKNEEMIDVYEVGSELAVSKGNITGIVEKAIIGAGKSIQYQMICYPHGERVQGVFNDFEVCPIEGKAKKVTIGFAQTPKNEIQREVTVLLDEQNGFVGANSSSADVIVNTFTLNEEELAEFKESMKEDIQNGQEQENIEAEESQKQE